jgi:hypothetical protein
MKKLIIETKCIEMHIVTIKCVGISNHHDLRSQKIRITSHSHNILNLVHTQTSS